MDTLKNIIDSSRKKKGLSIKSLAEQIGMTEQGFHTMLRKNSTKMETLKKLSVQLDIPITMFLDDDTKQKEEFLVSDSSNSEYWKGLIENLMKEIGELKIENWNLKKELGKYDTVHLAISAA